MASYHVLTGQDDGNAFRVVFHLPIPVANNRAGVAYRTALVNSGLGGTTTLPDGDGTGGTISAAEKTQVQAGQILEHAENFPTNPGESAVQLQARIDARYAELTTVGLDRAQKRLTYFGFARSV
jgi:hypothetical protein